MVLDTERERNGSVHGGAVVTFWVVNWKVGTSEFRFSWSELHPGLKQLGKGFYGIVVFGEWMVYRYSNYISPKQDAANSMPWMILLCQEAVGLLLRVIIVTTQHLGIIVWQKCQAGYCVAKHSPVFVQNSSILH